MKPLAILLLFSSGACVEYETTVTDHVMASWADDETQIGFSVANCVGKDANTDFVGDSAKCEHWFGIANADGSDPRRIGEMDEIPNKNLHDVYLMATRGYMLAGGAPAWRVDLTSGRVDALAQRGTTIPSRDGSMFAVLKSQCFPGDGDLVTFVNADTLETVATVACPDFWIELTAWSWGTAGELFVWNSTRVFTVTPGGTLSEVMVEAPCSEPSSSGTRTLSGKLVEAEVVAEEVRLSIEQDEALDPAGCAPAQM